MALTPAEAERRLARALARVTRTMQRTAEARRLATVAAFRTLARTIALEAERLGPVLDERASNELFAVVTTALAVVRSRYLALEQDTDELTLSAIVQLEMVHVELAVLLGVDRLGAQRVVTARTGAVPQDVAEALRASRRNGTSVAGLAADAITAGSAAAATLLARATAENFLPEDVGGDLARMLLGQDIDYAAYDLERPDLTPYRGMLHMAIAVAVSEGMNTVRETTARTLAALGLARTGRWTLSDRHRIICDCDRLASAEIGFGPGRHLVAIWPRAPHPHCGCYMSDVRITDLSRWAEGLR